MSEDDDDLLRDAETWAQADALLGRPARLEEALALKAHLDEEDRAAERLVAPLLTSPIRFRDAKLAENPKARHAGVVRCLCAAAHGLHEKRPQFSLLLARTAHAIAVALENRLCMALSLREGANALKYLGRFSEAHNALDSSEKLFDNTPGADPHDVAIVWYIRGMVFLEIDRFDEAHILATNCVRVFRDYGDRSREMAALLLGASSLHFAGRQSEAAATYEEVAQWARDESSPNILARAVNGAASAYLAAENIDRAEQSYLEALVLFDELGLTTERARVGWSLALILVRRGELVPGAEKLDAARTELRNLGLLNDHGLATLDWAAARLALGTPAGVADACKTIMMRFESQDMMRNARLALAYAHEALARGTATPPFIRHIRTYLELLPTRPKETFVPLQ
jgi:tetratricopeptide (TPR) repeat protein